MAGNPAAPAPPWFQLPPTLSPRTATVIGAGLAGCCVSYALAQRGVQVTLLDAGSCIAGAASGNTRGVLRPHVIRNDGLLNRFNQQAFRHTQSLLDTLQRLGHEPQYALPGVLQLLEKRGDWPPLQTGQAVDCHTASQLAGISLRSPALHFPDAGWVDAGSYCRALIAAIEGIELRTHCQLEKLTALAAGNHNNWQLQTSSPATGTQDSTAACVVIACGPGTQLFEQLAWLDLTISTGQTTRCRYLSPDGRITKVLTGRRFLIPESDYCTIGATHRREHSAVLPFTQGMAEDRAEDRAEDWAEDDADNLAAIAALNPALPGSLQPVAHWRALRASTPDRLPIAGAVPDAAFFASAYAGLQHGPAHANWPAARYLPGLYAFCGLGSRGIVSAALSGAILAEQICGPAKESTRLPREYHPLLHPARFLVRRLKRAPSPAA